MKNIKPFLLIEIYLSFSFLLIPLKLYSQSLLSQKIRDRIDAEVHSPIPTLLNNGNVTLSKFEVSSSVNVLDSVITFDVDLNQSQKLKFYYDEAGHIVSIITYNHKSGFWQYEMREDYEWNEDGFYIGYNLYTWKGNDWIDSVTIENEYYADGSHKNIISKTWNETNWENEWWDSYEYNENGDGILWETFQGKGNNWDAWWKTTYTYDYANNQYNRIDYTIRDQQYVERYKTLYTYAAGSPPSKYSTRYQQSKNLTTGVWTNNTYKTAEWNSNGYQMVFINQRWENESWVNDYKYLFQYNSLNRTTNVLYQVGENSNWINSLNETYSHDADGNMTFGICEQFSDGQWVPASSYAYIIEGSYGVNGYTTGSGFWYEVICHTLNGYSKTITDVHAKSDITTSFYLSQNYPNPFNPETNIEYKLSKGGFVTLKVYDILGRKVATLVDEFKQAGSYNSKFSIQDFQLSSGVYFYRLQAGNFSETKKMILIR